MELSSYWNMGAWFGPYNESRMLSGNHVNAEFGAVIAEELEGQLRLLPE
ncbi:MAG: hypothetical protein AABZ39_03245 [Spirochaetota bacterium]